MYDSTCEWNLRCECIFAFRNCSKVEVERLDRLDEFVTRMKNCEEEIVVDDAFASGE